MKSITLGLVAALALAALSPSLAAAKEDKGEAKLHEQGMKDTPALVQQLGLPCTVSDAKFAGVSKQKDAQGKETTTKVYEVACQGALGYMILAPEGGQAQAFDCLALMSNKPKEGQKDSGGLYCRLDANADPMKELQPIVTEAAPNCTLAQARWMGESQADKFEQYEIACSTGQAYVLQVPRAGSTHKLTAVDCMRVPDGTCQFFTKDKKVQLISSMAAASGRPCQVTDARYMGSLANGDSYYEVACSDAKAGYVFEADPTGKFMNAIDCARATSIGGGCQLTDAVAAQTAENDTYTQLATQIGYPCKVKAYHSFGLDQKTGREVVELACSDHPDGAIALMPVDKGQSGDVFNCIRAEARQLKCTLTPKEATYALLTKELSAAGKVCTVNNARPVGVTASGTDFIEVACAGGTPGDMVEYAAGGKEQVKSVVPCNSAGAKGIGGGCKLSQ